MRQLLAILFYVTVTSATAQQSDDAKVQVGVMVGIAVTTIDGPIVDHYAKRPTGFLQKRKGMAASVSVRYNFTKRIYGEFALGYFQKGGWFLHSGYVDDIVMPVNYLNIPVIVGFRTSTVSPVTLSPELGMSLGILINCNEPGCLNLDDTFQCCGPSPTTKDEYGVLYDIQSPISLVGGARLDVKVTNDMQVSGRFRYYDDINFFFGNEKDFSISGKGFSAEVGLLYKVK